MSDNSLRDIALRHLDKAKPVNELVGIAVNATAWIGLAAFLAKAVWVMPQTSDSPIDSWFRYAVTAAAIGSSLLAACGLFGPLLGILRDLQRSSGMRNLVLSSICILAISFGSVLWLLGIGFTFIGLANSIFGRN